jgi:regulatory protein
MIITSVEPQIKNPKRFNIFIDNKFAFGADEDLMVNQRLIVGKKLESEDLEKLFYEVEVGKLMEKAYNLFSFRMRSEREVRDWLKVKSFKEKVKNEQEISQEVMDLLIERLKQKGLINDLEFAKSWVEGRRRSKNLGIRALKMELSQKGIEREIIEEVVRGESLEVSEEQLAQQGLEKKMKIWKDLDKYKRRQKAVEFLMRKGFDYDLAKEVVEKSLEK